MLFQLRKIKKTRQQQRRKRTLQRRFLSGASVFYQTTFGLDFCWDAQNIPWAGNKWDLPSSGIGRASNSISVNAILSTPVASWTQLSKLNPLNHFSAEVRCTGTKIERTWSGLDFLDVLKKTYVFFSWGTHFFYIRMRIYISSLRTLEKKNIMIHSFFLFSGHTFRRKSLSNMSYVFFLCVRMWSQTKIVL